MTTADLLRFFTGQVLINCEGDLRELSSDQDKLPGFFKPKKENNIIQYNKILVSESLMLIVTYFTQSKAQSGLYIFNLCWSLVVSNILKYLMVKI